MPTHRPRATTGRRTLLAVCLVLLTATALAAAPRQVLVLYSNHRLLPANIEAEGGLRETLPPTVEVSAEFLDYPRFSSAPFVRALTTFLGEKYAATPPDVIVAGGAEALAFLLRNRPDLFPTTPVVHMGVQRSALDALLPLPADVVGVPIAFDFVGTIDLALRLHPGADRLVLVTGAAAPDRDFATQLSAAAALFQGRAQPEFLAGLPAAAVAERLGALGPGCVVVTPGYFEDGTGRRFTPLEAVRGMVAAAGAPLYAPFDPLLGTGIVGGSMPSFVDMGRQAAHTATALLAGTAPAALRLPPVMPTTLNLDWRAVHRWGIDTDRIPPDAIIHFKTPGFLAEHHRAVVAATALLLLQTGLIARLLIERRRRREAELAAQKQRFELAHVSRLAIAGELTGAIAHEINQPLGAILSNAEAAEIILDACRCPGPGPDRRPELREILADIRRDDRRASEVIRRLRALLDRREVEHHPFDLNETLHDTEALLRTEARRRQVSLEVRPAASAALLVGDRVQIQQVLINLALNAMEAVTALPPERRLIVVTCTQTASGPVITVRDSGPGIAPEHLPRLFESFFTTKRDGMGLGLSIARTLVQAHGGEIRVHPSPEGAIFQLAFPATQVPPGTEPTAP